MSKTNRNPIQAEEMDELSKAKISLERIKTNKNEQSKVPLRINSTTVIFVHPSKQTEEYRQEFINRMARFREPYLSD